MMKVHALIYRPIDAWAIVLAIYADGDCEELVRVREALEASQEYWREWHSTNRAESRKALPALKEQRNAAKEFFRETFFTDEACEKDEHLAYYEDCFYLSDMSLEEIEVKGAE